MSCNGLSIWSFGHSWLITRHHRQVFWSYQSDIGLWLREKILHKAALRSPATHSWHLICILLQLIAGTQYVCVAHTAEAPQEWQCHSAKHMAALHKPESSCLGS